LIPEALDNLEVFFEPRHHEYLFKKLRRLGQCKELALVKPARNKIIARTFGRRFCQHRSFYFKKSLFIQIVPDELCHPVPHYKVMLEFGSPEVEIPVFES